MLHHQIVQSPARLGLTNPNSPSLQNPTPPKYPSSQPQSQSQQQTPNSNVSAITTSSTLLSLLPPLPRAQSLLLQMASLASKLFEVSPNRALWLPAFRGSLPSFLSSQIQSMPPPPLESTPTSSKEVILLFASLQTQLFEAVGQLQEILDLQDAKQKIAREIRFKDGAVLAFANKLKEVERVLDILVDDYSSYRKPKRLKLEDNGVKEEDDGDSCTTTVASQLNLSVETKEKTVEAIIEPPPVQPADTNPLSNFAALQGLLPPNFTIPPGWKPGMPVDLPSNIPVPPPGWKPGDPVSLPMPSMEGQNMPHVPPPVLHKPPNIQVRHVNLDILDSDDGSSDYSSDDGSSDDED